MFFLLYCLVLVYFLFRLMFVFNSEGYTMSDLKLDEEISLSFMNYSNLLLICLF